MIAAKAVAFKEAMGPVQRYQAQIINNARALAEALIRHGLPPGRGRHRQPPDARGPADRGLTGKEADQALDRAGITVNKNMIPIDPEKPLVTSGMRIGTPAITTRGMKEPEMEIIAGLIHQALSATTDAPRLQKLEGQVRELCPSYPPPLSEERAHGPTGTVLRRPAAEGP